MVEFRTALIEVYTNAETLNIKVVDFETQETKEKAVLEDDFNEIEQAMGVPGVGLGMLLIKIGRAFNRAVTGGSSAS